jgi:alkylhydroperoxidase family enzyme
MSRLPLVSDDDGQAGPILARVRETAGGVPKLYRILGNSAELLQAWIDYGWSLRHDCVSDRGLRELSIMRLAQSVGSEYVWRSHWKTALDAGMTEEKLISLSQWHSSDLYSDTERAVLAATDELTAQTTLDDETWDHLRDLFDDRQVLEFVLTIAWYAGVVRVNGALQTPIESHHATVPRLRDVSG